MIAKVTNLARSPFSIVASIYRPRSVNALVGLRLLSDTLDIKIFDLIAELAVVQLKHVSFRELWLNSLVVGILTLARRKCRGDWGRRFRCST